MDDRKDWGIGFDVGQDLGGYVMQDRALLNQYEPDNRSRFRRLVDRLFPKRICPLPGSPDRHRSFGGDVVMVECVSRLSIADRLRVLIGGYVVTVTRIKTEWPVGETETTAVFYAKTPFQIDPPPPEKV